MAEANTTTPPAGTEGAPPATGEAELGDAGKAALAAERKARGEADKALRAAQARIAEFEDAGKSEAEKATAALQKAQNEAASALLTAARYEVAAEKGVPLAMAGRLQGSTRAELLADADELLKLIPAGNGATPPAGGLPREDLAPGGNLSNGSNSQALNGDPIVDALKAKLGIK